MSDDKKKQPPQPGQEPGQNSSDKTAKAHELADLALEITDKIRAHLPMKHTEAFDKAFALVTKVHDAEQAEKQADLNRQASSAEAENNRKFEGEHREADRKLTTDGMQQKAAQSAAKPKVKPSAK